ncbi:hypothetical protein BJ944DRAFT_267175 [Cunninghamella echinulata]|nr:hypothetical protein BJ944DRAFT_267175 [Cunninghamella echinulata]
MTTERISQLIPFIKCSDCGENVMLRNLGTHICSNMPPIPNIPILPAQKKDPYIPASKSTSSSTRMNNYPSSQSPYPISSTSSSLYNNNSNYNNPAKSPPSTPSSDRYLYQQNKYDNSSSSSLSSSSYDTYKQRPNNDASNGIGNAHKNASGSLDNLMADLMDSMNEAIDQCTPVRNSPPPVDGCAVCHKSFHRNDDSLMYEKKRYHERCFTCIVCRVPLDLMRAHEHQDKLYCQRDFTLVKKKVHCATCEGPIDNDVAPIKVLGKYYHPGHVRCYQCQEPLTEKSSYREHQGRVYCRKDYRKMTLPKCRGCGKPVEREAISSNELKGKWHVNCFGCQTCHESFPDNTFYVYDDAPYCKRHYHQLNNSLCRTCDDPIEGPCAQTNEGWRFHPPCFTCNRCGIPITDIYYMYDRKIYCEPHILELQQRKQVRAEKRRTQFGKI